ncbi:MAG: hypothetical protein ABI904_12260 [Chloroflexota bacterium]
MPDEKKKKDLHPETNFLPPLDMVLSFFKKKDKPAAVNDAPQETEEVQGHAVKRLIDHINHDEQQQTDQKTND